MVGAFEPTGWGGAQGAGAVLGGAGAGALARVSPEGVFSALLASARGEGAAASGGAGSAGGASRAREAAEGFVAQALVLPVLRQLRSSNQASAPFAPGAYERQFAGLLDQDIAQRIVRARGFGLVDTVVARLTKAVSTEVSA